MTKSVVGGLLIFGTLCLAGCAPKGIPESDATEPNTAEPAQPVSEDLASEDSATGLKLGPADGTASSDE